MATDDETLSGWDDERSSIIDDTLGELRDQRDDAQENHLYGTIEFNPQVFATGSHLIIGPIQFQTGFAAAPTIQLTQQQGTVNIYDVAPSTAVNNYSPFLVVPYIYSLRTDRGVVDGFNIGLYALTKPPAGIQRHVIHWVADGKASVYSDGHEQDTWTEEYDHNEPEYLTEDIGDTLTEDYDFDETIPT